MPGRYDSDDEYDEITREIAFGGSSEAPEPPAQPYPARREPDAPEPRAQPERPYPVRRELATPTPAPIRAREQQGEVPPPEPALDGIEIAMMVASSVLGGAVTDERRPGEFDGSFEIWTCPPEAIDPVRNAIAALGLPVDRRPLPPGLPAYVRGVPREALEIEGQPTALVAALADALHDQTLMRLIGDAMSSVRFGSESTVGRRGAVVHTIRIEPAEGQRLQIGSGADTPWACVICPCGTNTELMPGRDALSFAGVHMRLEIEAELALLGQQQPRLERTQN